MTSHVSRSDSIFVDRKLRKKPRHKGRGKSERNESREPPPWEEQGQRIPADKARVFEFCAGFCDHPHTNHRYGSDHLVPRAAGLLCLAAPMRGPCRQKLSPRYA